MNTTPPFPPKLWEQTPVAVQEYIRTLEARVAALEATVQQLLERLQQDSHNSSRPPSSDPPRALKQRPRRVPSGRKRGGQPGHPGQTRAFVPVEQVDAVVPVKPQQCSRCYYPLQGEDPQPFRHQVAELPRQAGRDGVSDAPFGLPGLRHVYPCGPASRGAHGRFSGHACRPLWPCALGRITCRNARHRTSWKTYLGFP